MEMVVQNQYVVPDDQVGNLKSQIKWLQRSGLCFTFFQLLCDVGLIIALFVFALSGNEGNQGLQLQGLQGVPGLKGEQGIQGIQGIEGQQGLQGPRGDQGNQGGKGDQGVQGVQGLMGPKREQGDKGEKGERGQQGIQGVEGDQGLLGPRGDQGMQGPQGQKGEKKQGLQGIQGLKGDQGMLGDKREQGIQGVQGLIYLDQFQDPKQQTCSTSAYCDITGLQKAFNVEKRSRLTVIGNGNLAATQGQCKVIFQLNGRAIGLGNGDGYGVGIMTDSSNYISTYVSNLASVIIDAGAYNYSGKFINLGYVVSL